MNGHALDAWIELARGPIFRIALAICVLGLIYRVASVIWQLRITHRRAGDRNLPIATLWRHTLSWLLPFKLVSKRPFYGLVTLIFHLGIIGVPLFYGGHVHLWRPAGFPWPVMPVGLADVLTLATIAALVAMLLGRWLVKASRQLTTREDIGILVLLLILGASGYLAAHPHVAPFAPRGLLLVHLLTGNLTLILIPTSKIVHCVLMPLTQWISELGWRFPASSGRDVAIALHKENEPV